MGNGGDLRATGKIGCGRGVRLSQAIEDCSRHWLTVFQYIREPAGRCKPIATCPIKRDHRRLAGERGETALKRVVFTETISTTQPTLSRETLICYHLFREGSEPESDVLLTAIYLLKSQLKWS
jgi:hypothetical protein